MDKRPSVRAMKAPTTSARSISASYCKMTFRIISGNLYEA